MRLSTFLTCFIVFSLFVPPLQAIDITLHKFLRPGRVEAEGHGDYDRLLTIINASISRPVNLQFSRIKRINRALMNEQHICTAPIGFNQFFMNVPEAKKEDFITSTPIDVISGHILSRPKEPVAQSIEALKGKRVAIWWGVPLEQYVASSEASVELVKTEDQAVQLLMAGRVDYAWGWLPDTPMHYDRMGYEAPNFDVNFTMMNVPISIMCNRSTLTEAFIKEANEILEIMRNNGHLKSVLSPYARVAGTDVPWDQIEE